MGSLFRKGGKLHPNYELSLSRLILEETRRVTRSFDRLSHEERRAAYHVLMRDEIGGDPALVPRERALTSIIRALADGELSAYLLDGSGGIYIIARNAWYREVSWNVNGEDCKSDLHTVRQYRPNLLRTEWPAMSYGVDNAEPFYSKRVGSRIMINREEAERWLQRYSQHSAQRRAHSPSRIRKFYSRLSPAAKGLSIQQLHRILGRAGVPRRAVEALDRPEKPSRGRKPKVTP